MMASDWWFAGSQEWQLVAEKQPTSAALLLGAAPNREEIEQQQPSSAVVRGLGGYCSGG